MTEKFTLKVKPAMEDYEQELIDAAVDFVLTRRHGRYEDVEKKDTELVKAVDWYLDETVP